MSKNTPRQKCSHGSKAFTAVNFRLSVSSTHQASCLQSQYTHKKPRVGIPATMMKTDSKMFLHIFNHLLVTSFIAFTSLTFDTNTGGAGFTASVSSTTTALCQFIAATRYPAPCCIPSLPPGSCLPYWLFRQNSSNVSPYPNPPEGPAQYHWVTREHWLAPLFWVTHEKWLALTTPFYSFLNSFSSDLSRLKQTRSIKERFILDFPVANRQRYPRENPVFSCKNFRE